MKFTNREKKAEKISKKEKNNIRILNRMFLAVVLIIVVLLIILGILVLRKKTGLSLEMPYEEHMTALSEQEEGLQLAESFAQDLCVSGDKIPLEGISFPAEEKAGLFDLDAKEVRCPKYPSAGISGQYYEGYDSPSCGEIWEYG